MPDTLHLRDAVEPGGRFSYQDYYVNGRRLAGMIDTRGCLPPFGWLSNPGFEQRFRRMLLLEELPDYDPQRIPLYVCNRCADYLCGYYSAVITREDDKIVWSDLRMGYIDYTALDDEQTYVCQAEDSGNPLRFSFDADQYRAVIEKGIPNP